MSGKKLQINTGGGKAAEVDKSRIAEYVFKFVLGFVVSCGKIVGGLSPFGVAFTASCGMGGGASVALIGSVSGYLLTCGFDQMVKYIPAALMMYIVCLTLKKWPPSGSTWFAPAASFAVMAIFSFACDTGRGAEFSAYMLCVADAVIAGAGTYFFARALSPWKGKLDFLRAEDIRHTVSVLFLISVILIAAGGIVVFDMISIGRAMGCVLVMLFAYKGGPASGCAAGTAFGLAMDSFSGGMWFTAAYAINGLISGVFAKQGKLIFTLMFIITNGTMAAFGIDLEIVPACLYEMFIASVIFMVIPNSFLLRLESFLPSSVSAMGQRRNTEYMRRRLEQASMAFDDLYRTVRDAVGLDRNDSDTAAVFDASAEKTCRMCPNSQYCWGAKYQSTLDALNTAAPVMLSRGKLLKEDLPEYFIDECKSPDDFVKAVNEELRGLMYRRQYRAKLLENQKAAFGQYSDISSILSGFASDMGSAAGYEPVYENKLRKYLSSKGIPGEVAVFRGIGGRLRAEISQTAAAKLKKNKDWLDELSAVMGVRLCTKERAGGEYLTLMEAEPLSASVGIAAISREGRGVSGDKGAYFKTDDGVLYVILSDGMGTGQEAEKYSSSAVEVLERFLRAGVSADTAVRILNDLMLLKNQDETGCATVDLVSINLFSGNSSVFKYGAATSYLKRDDLVERISGTSLAAGLGFPPEDMPDKFRLQMCPGNLAVMISDGVISGGSDDWLAEMISQYDGEDPKELAEQIVRRAVDRYGDEDDMMAFVISVTDRD